ncbi:transposase [Candidatus Enterovibrio escicola]|uniref:transposase n=1 Tax=Candidatus Enterovibrio escicola TaxID=1927127 RepID=UPI001CC248C5
MVWFYGFKLHLIINDQGSIILVKVTTVNVDDRKPVLEIIDEIWGVYTEIKGYISGSLELEFGDKGMTLITGVKNISQIKHSRYRSSISFNGQFAGGAYRLFISIKEAEHQDD